MRLDYLRYFDHLAEVLNYTRAAEDLYIAQPTLSVAIKRMEKELGIKLFQRSEGSTRIELTEMGKAYHEYVALALKDLDKGLRIAREIQGEMNSSVRVGTIYAMQGRFWSRLLSRSFLRTRASPRLLLNRPFRQSLPSACVKGISMWRSRLAWRGLRTLTMCWCGLSRWFWECTKTARSPNANQLTFPT